MNQNIALYITAAVALSTPIASIVITVMNNRHNRKIRNTELDHDTAISKLNLLYESKKTAFSNFLLDAGKVCTDMGNPVTELDFYAHAQTVLLFTSEQTQLLIMDFIQDVACQLDGPANDISCHDLQFQLSNIAIELNKELSALQSDIYSSKRK